MARSGRGKPIPKGPREENRPADVIGAAVKVIRIATGEEEDTPPPDSGEDPVAISTALPAGAAVGERYAPEGMRTLNG